MLRRLMYPPCSSFASFFDSYFSFESCPIRPFLDVLYFTCVSAETWNVENHSCCRKYSIITVVMNIFFHHLVPRKILSFIKKGTKNKTVFRSWYFQKSANKRTRRARTLYPLKLYNTRVRNAFRYAHNNKAE